ncbi:MAG TPA: M23 family metallopeptidase, partial [Methylomirabilota bacterium]|nr:M23 family metallopeptidase [Methylomirabilota bacterium]
LTIFALAAAAACGGGDAAQETTPTPRAPAATPTPDRPDLTIFRNFIYPITGACLPRSEGLMPNAPREYRSGVHEGVDFYDIDNCTEIVAGTAVVAAKDGVVVRADHDYHDLTAVELEAANARIAAGHADDPEVLDLFRGRQVWIDHGKGIITRYAHLGAIAEGAEVGAKVVQGQTVGFVGDSGTPESLSAPGTEIHLHWELRAGETFLGAGLAAWEVRMLYEALFEPLPP